MTQNKVNTCKLKKSALFIIVFAGLAQLVEQRIRNAWVVCSSHITGTILLSFQIMRAFFNNKLTFNIYFLFILYKKRGKKDEK